MLNPNISKAFVAGLFSCAMMVSSQSAFAYQDDVAAPPPNIDTNGDGIADAWDLDGDAKPDIWDLNGDGTPDAWDQDSDNKPDVYDTTGDGKPDSSKPPASK